MRAYKPLIRCVDCSWAFLAPVSKGNSPGRVPGFYALYFSLHAAEQKCTTWPPTVFFTDVAVET